MDNRKRNGNAGRTRFNIARMPSADFYTRLEQCTGGFEPPDVVLSSFCFGQPVTLLAIVMVDSNHPACAAHRYRRLKSLHVLDATGVVQSGKFVAIQMLK